MTVTNHLPFTTPSDLPERVRGRVQAALAETKNLVRHDDEARLLTLSYTDDAFERFMGRLVVSPLASRVIVVAVGDHSTSDRFVWPRPDGAPPGTDVAKSRIPLAVVFPDAFLERSTDPPRVRALVRALNDEINRRVLSENDVPALLLALLSRSIQVSGLPAASRWHTLGGAVTSPWFSGPLGGDVAVTGIDAETRLFSLDESGTRVGAGCAAGPLDSAVDLYDACPPLQPVRSLLASFLGSYAAPCRSTGSFRTTRVAAEP